MELIITLFAEIITPILASILTAILSFITSTISLIVKVYLWFSSRRKAKAAKQHPKRKLALRIIYYTAVFVFAAILCINYLFLKPALNLVCKNIYERTSIAIEFDHATAHLLWGNLQLRSLHIKRDLNPSLDFDLRIKSVDLSISLQNILRGKLVLHSLQVNGVTGEMIKRGKRRKKPRKNFIIREFLLKDSHVIFRTQKRPNAHITIAIQQMQCYDVQSKYFVYHTLLRSNTKGMIAQRPFSISTTSTATGYKNVWRATGIPLDDLSDVFSGFFAWFQKGKVDINSENHCHGTQIDMRHTFVLRNFQAQTPQNSTLNNIVAQRVENFLNRRQLEFPIDLQFTMAERDFAEMQSVEGSQLSQKIATAWIQGVMKKLPGNRVFNTIKNLWKKKDK
ncbi:hypothetical protein [Candidatus Uabimicrobium amorphum]|uniref:DUF748 domain-containing protein n=1 Tax=Uabimicrobium amorphum TaxID=2596890 RepID=A0A5S9F6F7_UABAM|nr:hypothetical protein [Candidatus Uabimicrobium amorphum]BBM87331.1 hypothetical protein UABAM_05740 [Candidatus Uabimicrobium amorphum]